MTGLDKMVLTLFGFGLILILIGAATPSQPKCVSYLFYEHGDSTVYETHCVGGVRPDSVANPPYKR